MRTYLSSWALLILFSRGCCTNATVLGAVLDRLDALEGVLMRSLLESVAAIAVTIYAASAAISGQTTDDNDPNRVPDWR